MSDTDTNADDRSTVSKMTDALPIHPWADSEAAHPYGGPFSYRDESHAFEYGLGLGFLVMLSLAYGTLPGVGMDPTGPLLGALLALAVAAVRKRKGEKRMVERALKEASAAGIEVGQDIPAVMYRQVTNEPHYYLSGVAVGFLAGAVVLVTTGHAGAVEGAVEAAFSLL